MCFFWCDVFFKLYFGGSNVLNVFHDSFEFVVGACDVVFIFLLDEGS